MTETTPPGGLCLSTGLMNHYENGNVDMTYLPCNGGKSPNITPHAYLADFQRVRGCVERDEPCCDAAGCACFREATDKWLNEQP